MVADASPVADSDPSSPHARVPLDVVELPEPVRAILKGHGVTSWYPPQAEALVPVLAGQNVLLACPTASGKSLVAYLAAWRAWTRGRTTLYLVPLRALAHEKAEELRAFESLGLRVAVSVGDFDLPSERLDRCDVLVATVEKADALLRRNVPWLDRLGVVVADEVHLLGDPDRGPTLEVALTRLRRRRTSLQFVALSATVGNSAAVADWLDAVHLTSSFRPVPLRRGVYHDGRITYTDGGTRDLETGRDPVGSLVADALAGNGQTLVFVNSRKSSETVAEALVPVVEARLAPADRERARRLAAELSEVSEETTEGVRRLSGLLPHAVAFHNASLTHAERTLIERGFKEGILKALAATPTLAAGINLPARRVVVRDTSRYDDRLGLQAPIPTFEIQQMLGRAGRPRFDSVGEAILLARRPEDQERLFDDYLSATPEDVQSRLAAEPALRMHLLALVASGAVTTERELNEFFEATFYGHTLALDDLHATLDDARRYLTEHGFLTADSALEATPFGRLTSDLYLDPVSADLLRRVLEQAPATVGTFPLLAAVAATPDLPPLFLRRPDGPSLLARYTEEASSLLVHPDEPPLHLDLELFLATLKTAAVLEAWLDERPLLELTETFGIGAGDLRAKAEDAEWLLFAAGRIAARYQRRLANRLDDLALRVRYGVREELLDLVRLRGIGRVRARALYAAGFPDRESLRGAPIDRVEQALRSRSLAEMVLRQLGRSSTGKGGKPSRDSDTAARPSPATSGRTPNARKPARTLEEFPAHEP